MPTDEPPDHHRLLWALDSAVRELRSRFEQIADSDDVEVEVDADALDEAGAMLDELEDEVDDRRVRVALLGDTNAGKSTLVNAVLGQRLLPSSSSGPGTAVVTTLRHRPGASITVEIQFATRANLRRACQELLDQQSLVENSDNVDTDVHDLIDASRRRLSRVFGASLDDYLATGHVSVLREVPEAAVIVDEGTRIVETTRADEVHQTLLAHADAAAAIGYLVDRVDITGDFPSLRTGVTLLDLPGLNDPDARRTDATRRAIADADVIWVVYPLDTGLAMSTIRAVQSTLTAHQTLLERDATRLRFVCTKNEAVADDTAWRLGLSAHATDDERRAARDATTLAELREKLDVLVRPLERRLGDLAPDAQRAVLEAPVHLVSAHEALRGGQSTGIATLADELDAVGARLAPDDALRLLGHAVDRVDALLGAIEQGSSSCDDADDADDADGDHEPVAGPQLRWFAAQLRAATASFVEQSSTAAMHAFDDVARLRNAWDSVSPQVLQAIVLRRGFFTGSGGAHYDGNADVAQSFFIALQPAWMQHFRHDLPAIVQTALDELTSITGVRPITLERAAHRCAREVETDLVQAIVETVRERLVPHYDRLVRNAAESTRTGLVQGLVDAIDGEREALRAGVVECMRTWLASVVDELVAAAYVDASPLLARRG